MASPHRWSPPRATIWPLAPTGIRGFTLATEDVHGVYEKVDFKPLEDSHTRMCIRIG
ncbi:hypothetical protein ACFVYE_06350 [Streptomyces sp. NPDC058239]|uniref:hypothetical protein n=1 Tax=unclassified Streptomyces TaxID=2593676 RepID=UPI00365BBDA0